MLVAHIKERRPNFETSRGINIRCPAAAGIPVSWTPADGAMTTLLAGSIRDAPVARRHSPRLSRRDWESFDFVDDRKHGIERDLAFTVDEVLRAALCDAHALR